MKKWLAFGFISLAYGLALLHIAIPHHHGAMRHSRLIITVPGCETAGSTAGFLRAVFATDLGYGHLETFSKSTDAAMDIGHPIAHLPAVFGVVICPATAGCEFQEVWGGYAVKLLKQLLLFSASPLRAPPRV